MADEHRRVEPRGVVGSGMLTDPERIEQLEHDRDRRERDWREAPKRKFGEVLTEAPARLPDDDAEASAPEDRRRQKKQPDENEARAQAGEGGDEPAAAAPAPVDVGDAAPLPKVPPDPRMARLHAMLSSTTNKSGRKR